MTEDQSPSPAGREIERAIVLRLMRRHYERRASVRAALAHIDPSELDAALERLQQHGVVEALTADTIRVSPCAQHLNDLGLFGV
jgi:hypothetical protein